MWRGSFPRTWEPLGAGAGSLRNFVFVVGVIAGLLVFFTLFRLVYVPLLRLFLRWKILFLSIPALLVALGLSVMAGLRTRGRVRGAGRFHVVGLQPLDGESLPGTWTRVHADA